MFYLLQWRSPHLIGAVVIFALTTVVAGCNSRESEIRGEENVDVGELAGGVVTLWTDSTELFMEHPALVVGAAGKFLIHLTVLPDFAPLRSGKITLHFEPRDGLDGFTIVQNAPRSPGIYGPSPNFPREGLWDLTITIESPQLRDVVSVPDLLVSASKADTPDVAAGLESGISFLKEQQWKTPGFRTSFASTGSIQQSFDASGEIVGRSTDRRIDRSRGPECVPRPRPAGWKGSDIGHAHPDPRRVRKLLCRRTARDARGAARVRASQATLRCGGHP